MTNPKSIRKGLKEDRKNGNKGIKTDQKDMSENLKEQAFNTSRYQCVCNTFCSCISLMASNFYIVHHEFRAGTSSKWWETAYAAMAPGGGWDEAVAANK